MSDPRPLASSEAVSAQPYVRQALRLLEADLRELALLALGDWAELSLVDPALFRAVANLQRPTWGHWNGLLAALREARKATLRAGSPAQRQRVQQASILNPILDELGGEADRDLARALGPLAELVRAQLGRRPRLEQLLALPITLRNEVAHFQPDDPHWWDRAADGLRPLLAWRESARLRAGTWDAVHYREPWFLPDTRAALNGFDRNTVRYADPSGQRFESGAPMQPLLAALGRLLGKEQARDEALHQLLSRAAPEELKGVLLGDYLVRGPAVGSGGFAEVFAAMQVSTGRQVAVKILRDDLDEDARARFQQEGAILAQFNHPHIVRVLGRGEDPWFPPHDIAVAQSLAAEPWFAEWTRGRPTRCYLALEWVEGLTLEQVYQGQRPQPPDWREATRWFAQAAGALAAVHGAGLVHRDVKPGNLMVNAEGTITLMDFGIARTQDELRTIRTTPNRVLGTPAYLAPEQLEARSPEAGVGQASDVYGLCATFYELYTGRRLFGHDRETEHVVNTRKLSEPHPEQPRLFLRELPWEIDTVLLGGLQREPTARYRSATDLERDLQHILRDEPIEYRRPSAGRRLRLWWRRNPRVARLTVTSAALLVLLAAGSLTAALVIDGLRDQERQAKENEGNARKDAERSDRESTRRLVRLLIADGWRGFGDGDALAAVPLFVQALEADRKNPAAEPTHRLRVAAALRRCPRLTQVWFPGRWAGAAAFRPDGQLVLTVGGDGSAQVWDVESGQPVGKPLRQESGLTGGAFSPDGKRILTWSRPAGKTGGGARLWDAATGQPLGPPMQTGALVTQAGFSSDGRYVKLNLTRHFGGGGVQGIGFSVAVHSGHTAEPARLPGVEEGAVGDVLFAAKAPRVLVLTQKQAEREVQVWDLATGKPVGPTFQPALDPHLHLDDDGKRVLVVDALGEQAQVWDATTGKPLGPPIQHGRKIRHAALAPDGMRVATVSEHEWVQEGMRPLKPGETQVWDVASGSRLGEVFRHDEDVKSAFFAAAGDQVVTISATQARLWDVSSSQPLTPPLRHRHGLNGVRVSVDARRLVTWGQDGSVRLWDLASTDQLGFIHPEGLVGGAQVHFSGDRRVEVSPDGQRLLVNVLWRARAWDVQTGQPLTDYGVKDLSIGVVRFSPDGRLVAGGGSLNLRNERRFLPTAYVWDTATGTVVAGPLQHDGKLPAGGSPAVQTLAFHPDGRRLATGAQDGTVRLWDSQTGKSLFSEPLQHRSEVRSVAFSPDGTRLLSVAKPLFAEESEVRLWDVTTGAETAPRLDAPPRTHLAVLSRDGRHLVLGAEAPNGPRSNSPGASGVVEVRSLPDGTRLGPPIVVPESLTAVALSPEGTRVLAAWGRSARVYDLATGSPITPVLEHSDTIAEARFFREGRLIYCCCGRDFNLARKLGEVRIWDADTGDLVTPPLRHILPVRSAALNPQETMLVAGGEDLVRLWDLSLDSRPAEELRLLARLLSETEVDPRSHIAVLSPADYRATWEQYEGRNSAARRVPTPAEVVAWHTREALHAERAGEWRTADRHLVALLASRPQDEQLHARRGFARFHLADWEQAARLFGRSLELANKDWNIRYHRGRALAQLQKWEEALRDYDTVLQAVQTEWEVYHQRGWAHYQLNRYDQAEANCTEAIALLGGKLPDVALHPQLLEQRAELEALNGKWQPWYTRGLARHNSGHHELAVEDYSIVLRAKPRHTWALYHRAQCHQALGQLDGAVRDHDAAIQGGLNDWRPWAGRAAIAAQRGRWADAGKDYTEALQRRPDSSSVWYEAALVQARLGDRQRSRSVCAAMVAWAADRSLGARLQTALTCAAVDGVTDWATLAKWCEEGQEKKVKQVGLVRGAILYRQGRFAEARQPLQEIARGTDEVGKAAAHLWLALTYQRDGQEKEAAHGLAEGLRTAKSAAAQGAWMDRVLLELLRAEAEERTSRRSPARPGAPSAPANDRE